MKWRREKFSPKRHLNLDLCDTDAGARFPNAPKLFRWHKSLCIFNKNTFQALKLGNYFAFPYIWNILKEKLFTASGSQFQELLFGPAKLPGLSRNGPQCSISFWLEKHRYRKGRDSNPSPSSHYCLSGAHNCGDHVTLLNLFPVTDWCYRS